MAVEMTNAHTREYEANGRRYRRIRGGWEVFTGFPGAPWMPETGSAVPSEVWSAFEEQQKRDAAWSFQTHGNRGWKTQFTDTELVVRNHMKRHPRRRMRIVSPDGEIVEKVWT